VLAQLGGDILNRASESGSLMTGWSYYFVSAFLCVYVVTLIVLAIYGLHRYILVYLYYKYKRNKPVCSNRFDDLPEICVQLPMYNERYVARRIIEHVCRLDYPKDKLHIQVLDDSTDQTVGIASQTADEFKAKGFKIDYLHREDRSGFKAGALENGLKHTDATFVAIFDSDFIPERDVLRRTIHYFADPTVGMIQVRWEHLNRGYSLLTKSQAILLDGHFMIEHTARNRSGRFMSFNGTAGLWRRSCIRDAGGWQHDTLTEDLDLSYRAQMKGWNFIFLPEVISPAELPPEINAFKQQQHRWTKGGAQTARKLLRKILTSRVGWKIKLEAFFHLTSCTVYIYIVALSIMLCPALYLRLGVFKHNMVATVVFDVSLFLLATCSASVFYLCSQREIFNRWRDKVKYLPFLMALGIGISISNSLAAIEGFFRKGGEFVRTPKFGAGATPEGKWGNTLPVFKEIRRRYMPVIELAFGSYMLLGAGMCVYHRMAFFSLPFLILFATGYFYVGVTSLVVQYHQSVGARREAAHKTLAKARPAPNLSPVCELADRPTMPAEPPPAKTQSVLNK